MSKSKNVLVLLPGGSDPQKVEKYKEHFAELIRLSKEEYGFAHGEVLSLPGHESYKPKNYWNIAKAAEVLKDKIDELAKEYDTITINARCGGCYVVLEYLKQGAINSQINSIRLWGAVSLEILIESFKSTEDKQKEKMGLSFNEESLNSYSEDFVDYFDLITLPDHLTIKIGFGTKDEFVVKKDIDKLEKNIKNSNNKNRITVTRLEGSGHLVESPFPDDFIKFCFE